MRRIWRAILLVATTHDGNTPMTTLEDIYHTMRSGNFAHAEQLCQSLLNREPSNVEALRILAGIANHHGHFAQGLEILQRAVSLRPDFVPALLDLGTSYARMNQLDQSERTLSSLTELQADNANAWFFLGNTQRQQRKFSHALRSYLEAVDCSPDSAPAHNNVADMYRELHHYDDALKHYNIALDIKPDLIEAFNGRGVLYAIMGDYPQAAADYTSALALDSTSTITHFNRAFLLLHQGNYEEGWREYEKRPALTQTEAIRGFRQPRWRGENIEGKTILLHPEQGFGDTLQFCRYTKMVAERGARVIAFVQPHLKTLLMGLDGAHRLVTRDEPLPDFDVHCTYLSLPGIFQTRQNTIPAQERYIQAPLDRVAQWKQRIGDKRRPRVGIVWSGSANHSSDHNRTLTLEYFLTAITGDVELFSLQNELRTGDENTLEKSSVIHFGAELGDFADTAALIEQMDLVITVDTSIAHLAASLGVPTWTLILHYPDWRWRREGDQTAWYPTMRLFRQQQPGNWDHELGEIRNALATWLGTMRSTH